MQSADTRVGSPDPQQAQHGMRRYDAVAPLGGERVGVARQDEPGARRDPSRNRATRGVSHHADLMDGHEIRLDWMLRAAGSCPLGRPRRGRNSPAGVWPHGLKTPRGGTRGRRGAMLACIGRPVYMFHVMAPRSLAAALLILGSAVPYTAPMLCTALGSHHASRVAPCPDQSLPGPGAGHHGCDLAQCATAYLAPPSTPLGISLALSIVELPRTSTDDGFDGDVRPPLTPPPIV